MTGQIEVVDASPPPSEAVAKMPKIIKAGGGNLSYLFGKKSSV